MITKELNNYTSFDFSAQVSRVRPISGLKDAVIQSLRKIKSPSGRKKEGLYLAEGPDLCARAVKYGAEVHALICTEGFIHQEEGLHLLMIMPEDTPIYSCSEGMLNKCLEAKPTPSCVALVKRTEHVWHPQNQLANLPSLYLGVDQGDNADNLGMLLRSAEATGVSGVLLGGGTVDPWGRRVVRAARGAMFDLPLSIEESTLEAVRKAQGHGLQVISTSAKTKQNYTEIDYTKPSLLLVGNEHYGINEKVVDASDHCVLLPMLGHIHSLNIAVAASVILYEAQRQRGWSSARQAQKG